MMTGSAAQRSPVLRSQVQHSAAQCNANILFVYVLVNIKSYHI
jgi:hypothetical protein